MAVRLYADIVRYYEHVTPYLQQQEAQHGLAFGILSSRIMQPERLTGEEFFAALLVGDRVVGAVLRTPPFNAYITHIAAAEPAPLWVEAAEALHAAYGAALPGTVGPRPAALGLVEAWQVLTGQGYAIEMEQGVYKATTITPPQGVAGSWRFAGEADRDLIAGWLAGFHRDAFGEEPDPQRTGQLVESYITRNRQQGTFIWQVGGEPVAMANYRGPTPHGIRVVGVYTPPEHRRKGYGSAVTAAISRYNLEQLGRAFCMLYTDMANSTSNHIYQQIGYQRIGESVMTHIGDAPLAH